MKIIINNFINQKRNFFIFLFLFVVSLIIYSNSLNGNFLFDDNPLIVDNQDIRDVRKIPSLFTNDIFKFSFPAFDNNYNYYRPVQTFLFALIYRVSGLNPLGYHLTSIIIHSLNALLVFYLINKLFANYSLAFLSSILFCVHPIHTETVSYISSIAELLVGLFILLTITSYIRYIESAKIMEYAISILSFILALLSKETGFLIFVPFFMLVIGLKSKFSRSSVWLHFFSFIGILVIYIRLRLTLLMPIHSFPNSPYPFLFDVLNFSNSLIEYIKLLIAPRTLHIFRNIMPISFSRPLQIIMPALLLISLAAVLIVSIKQKRYILLLGMSWFVLGLMHLVRFMYKFRGHVTMEEHWVYLASIGFFLIAAYLILKIKRPRAIMAVSIFVIVAFSSLTFINSNHWKDEISFYRYNLKLIEPHLSIVPRLNLTIALYKRGLYKDALAEVNSILAIAPENLYAYIQLGDIFRAMKRFPEAEQAYKQALKIDYFCWQANRKLKLIAEETGQEFKDEIDPRLPPTEAKICSLIRMGDFDKAIETLKEVLLTSPSPQFYTLYGITFAKLGLYHQAIEAFNAAIKLDPHYTLALYNLAVIYENKHEQNKADEIINRLKAHKTTK
jgi:tetratricopeptide (TPR) repeat protein